MKKLTHQLFQRKFKSYPVRYYVQDSHLSNSSLPMENSHKAYNYEIKRSGEKFLHSYYTLVEEPNLSSGEKYFEYLEYSDIASFPTVKELEAFSTKTQRAYSVGPHYRITYSYNNKILTITNVKYSMPYVLFTGLIYTVEEFIFILERTQVLTLYNDEIYDIES